MSDDDTIYNLRIINAAELPLTKRNHPPHAFVNVTVPGFKYKTKAVKRSRDPHWDEAIRFMAKDRSTTLSLDVRHKSFVFYTALLGSVHAKIGDLVDRCNDNKEVELDLDIEGHRNEAQGKSKIIIQFSAPETSEAVGAALADARNEADDIGGSKVATAVGFVDGAQEYVEGAQSIASNLDAFGTVLDKIDVLVKIVDKTASLHPYAQLAWGVVSSAYKVARNQVTTDQNLIKLVDTMESVYSFVDAIQSNVSEKVKVLEDVIKRILAQTIECSMFIKEYHKQGGFAQRTLCGLIKDNAGLIEKQTQCLISLKKSFDSGVTVQTAIVSFRIQEDVSKMLRKQTLLELAPADMESSLKQGCFPSTRQDILNDIVKWATEPSSGQNILWLYGLAGSGKSTICITITRFFRDLGRLGSFIFFDCAFPERSHPSKVIRTLAYKLGMFDPRIGAAISSAIDNYPSVKDAPLRAQFTRLIIEPLASLPELETGGPILLAFDALDECGDPENRRMLMRVLGKESSRLPSFIRVLLISRPLEDITTALQDKPHILAHNLELSFNVGSRDIVAYIQHHLGDIQRRKLPQQPDWPGDEAIQDLAEHSRGLFIWASTAVKFIDRFNPAKSLAVILGGEKSSKAQLALDKLYATSLADADSWDDDDFIEQFRSVLEVILVLQNPLVTSTLDRLTGVPEGQESGRAVSKLACVIADEPTLHLLHPSFADFLFSRERCGREMWYFDELACHQHVAKICLRRLLDGGLKRNMCNLTLSVPLKDEQIPDDVAYACIFWINHVCLIKPDSVADLLVAFLTTHVLHWFEAMSILRRSRDTIVLLDRLKNWVTKNCRERRDLVELVSDAWRFAQAFGVVIETHPLLVYASALPFAPTSSTMYKLYHDAQTYPTIAGGWQQLWSRLLFTLKKHTDWVTSVAFSPDCTRMISGSADGTVRLWDAVSGADTLPPLQGHEGQVTSVASSPNGTCFASGSFDHSVRVWDAASGTEMFPPFRGHQDIVTSVAFSPDGTCIASASRDNTVRVWDIASGTEVLSPLRGHDDQVTSVTFSPDGSRIISGSRDRTIRVWDAVSGTEVLPPLGGHEGWVFVAVSPDGNRIVSGSEDAIVRVWDLSSATALPPFRGHENAVTSVAFSSEGDRIVSGSADRTVRIWDASSGAEATSPIRGHENDVISIAVSPDSTRIVSGSFDNAVCLWDIDPNIATLPPVTEHDDMVQIVAFSPDGTRIVSASYDLTLRVWDSVSLASVAPPLRGHEKLICSVAFSPDGNRIASGSVDQTARIWDIASGADPILLHGHDSDVSVVIFSPDGTHVVTGSYDHTIRIWDAVSGVGKLSPLQGHMDRIYSVAFSPDGKRIVSGSADNTVRIWDALSGAEVLPPLHGHDNMISSVSFSPDSTRIVSGSHDNSIRVWDAVSGAAALPPLQGHRDPIISVAFCPDGAHIVSRSKLQNLIWDGATGHPYVWDGTRDENSHALHGINTLALNPDGWIVDFAANQTVSKLPAMISPWCSATFDKTVAIGTQGGHVVILHFPPTMFNSPGTRPAETPSED